MMNLTKHVEISLDLEDDDVAIEIRYFENVSYISIYFIFTFHVIHILMCY